MASAPRDSGRRPDPDALLVLAAGDGRGKLTVFLGAAPGVGKTYAMLARAARLKADGVDVVIGLVETHDRAETAALMQGLELLPRRPVEYRGRTLAEFDLDAALARRPKLLIVDELAHTNPPDCRHPKRHQDVEELLAAGIDVWTALNIQHLESLSDVVSRITGVTVRETVPDVVLKRADEVIVVDVTPAELIQRLHEGKVYLPDNARRAVDGFFKPATLTALRELALRRTADRVDEQMVRYLRQNAIEGPWATGERLIVCVGPDPLSASVVRSAGRLASALGAPWTAVHVERPDHALDDAAAIRRLDENLRLAERLGAGVERLAGNDVPAELIRFAQRENVTQIVVGRSRAGWISRLRRRSLHDAIVQRAFDIDVHVITAGHAEAGPAPAGRRRRRFPLRVGGLAAPPLAVVLAVGAGMLLREVLTLPNLSMLFLTAVMFCALTYGLWPAITAAFLSFLAYNFFFTPPLYTLTVAEPYELFALLIFLLVAVLTGGLAGRVRDQAALVRGRAAATQALYQFSRTLSAAAKLDDVIWAAAAHLHAALGARVLFAMPTAGGDLDVQAAWPPADPLDAGEMSAAHWALEKKEPAGFRTATLPNTRYRFVPLLTARGVVAVCGIDLKAREAPWTADEERTLAAVLDQTTVAIDRALLVAETARADVLAQSEKLRTALLSSISHDLRTPLSTITGAASSLRELGDALTQEGRADLLRSVEEEARRLSRFVDNLLDMTRIESGALDARRDWVDVADVIRSSVSRARAAFPGTGIETSVATDLPLVRGDSVLLGHVLFNLLDNAQKYGNSAAGTQVFARKEGTDLVISVTDQGRGIPPAQLEAVFDKFRRLNTSVDGRDAGTGLGLSICRGLVEAMGGTVRAESPAVRKRGTRFIVRLPIGVGSA